MIYQKCANFIVSVACKIQIVFFAGRNIFGQSSYSSVFNSYSLHLVLEHFYPVIGFAKYDCFLILDILYDHILSGIDHLLGDREPEIGSFAVYAVYTDLSAHRFNKSLGDGQA